MPSGPTAPDPAAIRLTWKYPHRERKADEMSTLLRRDPRAMFPDLVEWFEEPFTTLRPYLAQPIKVEDYIEGDHYIVRGGTGRDRPGEGRRGDGERRLPDDPRRAARQDRGQAPDGVPVRSFTRSLPLPAHVNEDDVKATYHDASSPSPLACTPRRRSRQKIEVKPPRRRPSRWPEVSARDSGRAPRSAATAMRPTGAIPARAMGPRRGRIRCWTAYEILVMTHGPGTLTGGRR